MITKVKLKDDVLTAKVCATQPQIEEGMMNKTFEDFESMVFLMNTLSHSFWMKDCITPLDIVFVDQDRKITSIHKNCPECKQEPCEHYNGSGQYVLELPAGTCDECGIEEGQKIKLTI